MNLPENEISDSEKNAHQKTHPNLVSVQIEPTSRCNLNCISCAKHDYHSIWQETDLKEQLYYKIISELPESVKSAHLQGWGDPLLHPDIDNFVTRTKKKKLLVSFTTTGTTMSAELANRLIGCGLDSITFSMTGGNETTHDKLRGSSSFSLLEKAIDTFEEARKASSSEIKTSVSFLLTALNIHELPQAIKWCRKRNIDLFSTVHLTQTASKRQENLRFQVDRLTSSTRWLRRRSWLAGLFSKTRIELKSFVPEPTPVCDKNPLNTLFISSNGLVSPCVFLCPPIGTSRLGWLHRGRKSHFRPFVLGDCRHESIEKIWKKPLYTTFRDQFQKRLNIYEEAMAQVGYSMEGPKQLEKALIRINNGFTDNPPPEQCRFCYKMDGF